jgi:hypothetical protein
MTYNKVNTFPYGVAPKKEVNYTLAGRLVHKINILLFPTGCLVPEVGPNIICGGNLPLTGVYHIQQTKSGKYLILKSVESDEVIAIANAIDDVYYLHPIDEREKVCVPAVRSRCIREDSRKLFKL